MDELSKRPEEWVDIALDDMFVEDLELDLFDSPAEPAGNGGGSLKRRDYFRHLIELQTELIKLQTWVSHSGAKLVVIFEGRDSAGKGGVIKRITQRLNPRVCRVVSLPAPTERERGQWYFQRYVAHLPARGEMTLFD